MIRCVFLLFKFINLITSFFFMKGKHMTLLGCLLIIIFLIAYEKRKNSKLAEEESQKFWERESMANLTESKDISHLNYVDVPFSKLPFDPNASGEFLAVQKELERLKERKFVNLTGYTNTDLKLAYGRANLDLLSSYDQNFTLLTRTLHKWGVLLYEAERFSEAELVLQTSVLCGTDVSKTYITLAEIYAKTQRPKQIEALIEAAKTIHTVIRESTIKELKQILSSVYAAS